MRETEFVCSWCAVPVQKDFNHVGDCRTNCAGTFTHPGSGSCRRRFTELTHKQVMEVTK